MRSRGDGEHTPSEQRVRDEHRVHGPAQLQDAAGGGGGAAHDDSPLLGDRSQVRGSTVSTRTMKACNSLM
jgi:hypothetical protein